MITRDDVLIALSNSGESAELMAIIPIVKRLGGKVIAMTGNPASSLAREADAHLDAGVAISWAHSCCKPLHATSECRMA